MITENKFRHAVIGILYLLRYGITMFGVMVLPRVPVLRRILPMESHLANIWNIRGKVVTETENIVKLVLRSTNRADLQRLGASGTVDL